MSSQTMQSFKAFICPKCSTKGTLEISQSIALPPDNRSDDIIIQILACRQCGFRGGAIFEESRRGAMTGESWQHTGFLVRDIQLDALIAVMSGCPDPNNINCLCQVHTLLAHKNKRGTWQRPAGFDDQRTFSLNYV